MFFSSQHKKLRIFTDSFKDFECLRASFRYITKLRRNGPSGKFIYYELIIFFSNHSEFHVLPNSK